MDEEELIIDDFTIALHAMEAMEEGEDDGQRNQDH